MSRTGVCFLLALVLWLGPCVEGQSARSVSRIEGGGSEGGGGVTLQQTQTAKPDPCAEKETVANPTRPNWDTSTTTTQCGVVESDFGWVLQPMDRVTKQQQLISSVRYGLTPRVDLRFGMTNQVIQYGGGNPAIHGVGDQWLSFRWRFAEQSHVLPALAFSYGYKYATADVEKGFGSGFGDHQLVLIASRDAGKNHFDFNLVGTITGLGLGQGHEGAAQMGLALTRPLTKRFSGVLESYGGPQPGTPDRFGANFAGGSYQINPRIYVDGAYARTYTAGAPRSQLMFGITVARRPRVHVPHSWLPRRIVG